MRASASIVIERPAADVWPYLSDPLREPEWSGLALERARISAGLMEAGARFRGVDEILGLRIETEWRIVQFDPPDRYASRTDRPFVAEWHTTLEPADGGTRVTRVCISPSLEGFFGMVSDPVVMRVIERQSEEDLVELKRLVEGAANGVSAPPSPGMTPSRTRSSSRRRG